ncbi:GAF and ANTAR domain-containing protein [Amycolatopsis aidingensis]|uniref:GAF and ANTAR domain-containing protein n=1 Tax=Amycolatopsis aidingensis TaxID=2842453 RepID=UPI001C0CE616|nr:GAF and ANTAR domain-containing protein [Amycolatopsis aidingensis]
MTAVDRRAREAFIALADSLVAGFEIIEFLEELSARCAELLDLSASGLLLVDHRGALNLVAASTEQVRLLELFELQNEEGPCLEAYRSGQVVTCSDLAVATQRWPRFATAATEAGFAGVHALPMRLRAEVIGAVSLFSTSRRSLEPDALALGQALTDVATVSVLHQRAMRSPEVVVEELQAALNSRILVKQATGVLAERAGVTVGPALRLLRGHGRDTGQGLGDLARAVVHGTADVAAILSARPAE